MLAKAFALALVGLIGNSGSSHAQLSDAIETAKRICSEASAFIADAIEKMHWASVMKETKQQLKDVRDQLREAYEDREKLNNKLEIAKTKISYTKAMQKAKDPMTPADVQKELDNKWWDDDGEVIDFPKGFHPATEQEKAEKRKDSLEKSIKKNESNIEYYRQRETIFRYRMKLGGEEPPMNLNPNESDSFNPDMIGGCPDWTGLQYASRIPDDYRTGEPVSYSVPSFATDNTSYCTFGEGTGVPGYLTAANDNGEVIPRTTDGGGTTPKRDDTPPPKETPKKPETPTATPADPPKTPDPPPPTQTTDNPPDTPKTPDDPPVTIFIKATEAVLDGGQTGEPIQGQVVKLVMKEKPGLPTNAENKIDTGFDKPAPQCTTGADGQCKVDVPAQDRALYAMSQTPSIGGKPVNNFRMQVNVAKHSGGVAETTGKQLVSLANSMSSSNVSAELVKIGNRTFLRLGFNTPGGATDNLLEKFSKLLGVSVEVDICLIKEPGPPLGAEPVSYAAINQELPHAAIRLQASKRAPSR
jgi:hypothetical protein